MFVGVMRLGIVTLALGGVVVSRPVLAQAGSPRVDAAELAPVKILRGMERVYAGCRTYRDAGEVRTALATEGGRAGSERPFVTAFVRPGRLRFQFTEPGLGDRSSSYIVWSDGSEVRSWWDAKPGVRRPGSLQAALAPAAGISGGSSVRAPEASPTP